uniref:Uncharacterized protein n=1 Tax=Triticum urartu TaxID=4572 RepID=A0A8R7RE76_TRIUA
SSLDPDEEAVLHVEYDGELRLHDVPGHHLHGEVPRHGRHRHLHLHQHHLLPEARPGARVEGHELVGRHVPQLPVLGDPPLRPELPAVGAPHPLHPPHGVVEHQDLVPGPHLVTARQHVVGGHRLCLHRQRRVEAEALAHRRVQVQQVLQLPRLEGHHAVGSDGSPGSYGGQLLQELFLYPRVRGDEVGEPREGGAGGVAARNQEVHGHVPDVRVRVGVARYLLVADERGQQVGRRLVGALLAVGGSPASNGGRHGFVSRTARGRLMPDVQPPHHLPARHRHDVPDEDGAQNVVHGAREGHVRQADGQAPGVDAEDEVACRVKGPTREHVLQVARRVGVGGVGEEREHALLHLVEAGLRHKGAVPRGGHEHLGLRPLAPPALAVGVEDAAAEDVEHLGEHVALGVVLEVGGEDVADVGRVAGDEVAE